MALPNKRWKLMTKNICKDSSDLAEQLFIENITSCTKGIEIEASNGQLLTLRRK